MDKLRWLVNTVLFLVLIDLIFFGYIYLDRNHPEKTQAFHIDYWVVKAEILPANLSQESSLMSPNIRFNHNEISFFINPNCDVTKANKIIEAFFILSNKTGNLLFYPTDEAGSDIDLSCSQSKQETAENELIAGEGGPTLINTTLYPLIVRGNVYLYNTLNCPQPITELHEILHVFGFLQVSDPSKIMYPYLDCDQVIDEGVITTLKEIYSEEAKADLYFTKVGAVKKGRYMDVSVEINNDGLIDAKNVSFDLSVGNEKIDSYELNNIGYGAGKTVYLSNIPLPATRKGVVLLNLSTSTEEYNLKNNYVELTPAE